jgi:hypothetical protein
MTALGPFNRFRDIPQFTRSAAYKCEQSWRYLEGWLADQDDPGCQQVLVLDPDFQRAHVWNEKQQIRYVEFILRGGQSSRDLYFNHPRWNSDFRGELVLVDGKQRLQAVRRFLANEIPAFGRLYGEYADKLPHDCAFTVHINNLKTRKEVLQWYIDLNAGGVAHTEEEIAKVYALLLKEAA